MAEDQLYRQFLAGDAKAGDQLMLGLADAVTVYLSAILHNTQDAEELMLDCFSVILVKKPRIRDGSFRAYLFKMARNKAIRKLRLYFRRNEFSLDETLITQSELPEDAVWKNERNAKLYSCMNRILPQYRETLWLVYCTGMSYAQAAQILGVETKRVEDLLRNGKKQLRRELETEGITDADI